MQDLNAVSSEYMPNAATGLENEFILNWYPKRITNRTGKVEKLLELGIGHGITARHFAHFASEHTIVDGSSVVIDQFKDNNPAFSGNVVLDYFESYTPGIVFDVIVMGFVLEHVDSPDLILSRYREFLKSGGKLYVAVPNAKSMNRRLGLEMGLIDDIYGLNANDIAQGHQRQYCRDTLRKTIERNGYNISYEEGIYLKPLPLSTLKTLDNFNANLDAMLHVGVDFPDLCVGLLIEVTPQ